MSEARDDSRSDPLALAVALISARRAGVELRTATFDLLGLHDPDPSVVVTRTVAASIGLVEVANLLLVLLADAKDRSAESVLQTVAVAVARSGDTPDHGAP